MKSSLTLCPFHQGGTTPPSPNPRKISTRSSHVLYTWLLFVFLLVSSLEGAVIDSSSSDEQVYGFNYNDHHSSSSSSSSSNNNVSSNGFSPGGGDLDPYHHNGDYNVDLGEEWSKIGSRIRKPKCVAIPQNMTLCHDIGYHNMLLPNILEHDTMSEVTAQARSWVPLININCHPDTRVFLCSLFSPVCVGRIILPCRSLCQEVYGRCEFRMKAYGFDWPKMLECNKFPLDNDMCIKPIHNINADNNCTACRHPLTYEALIDHFCRSDIVIKATLKTFKDLQGDRELVLRKKKKIYKSKGISRRTARKLVPVIEGGASCVCDTINKTQERYLLMGKKVGDKMVILFGRPWEKKNREFRKAIRAIRKSSTCEGIFNELSRNGIEKHGPNATVQNEKKRVKGNRKGKKGKKGRKGKKKKKRDKTKKGRKGRKGKKGNNKVKKRRRRNRKGEKKSEKRGGKNKAATNESSRPKTSQEEKWAREDQALSNFMKASN